jgi:hypothetical protein
MTDVSAPAVSAVPPAPAGDAAASPPMGARTSTRRYDRGIVEGNLRSAVWRIAWPTMLTNILGGLQGMIDHALVGNFVGYKANAAIGVSWQVFLVVIMFINSLFSGMSVLVARFAGAGNDEMVDRSVYQAFLTCRRACHCLCWRPSATSCRRRCSTW